ncbi:MAG: hypothetical protein BGO25_18110 [Acidobacteriales bacterium 59-55]|nr:hypothetical protein [Terriglobales bacterium]OJV41590.1 MAG: hypothetical protein BGO25_18110 [Acidobacteriales bacterium 59-55]
MTRPYYSARTHPQQLLLRDFFSRVSSLFTIFHRKDYFKERTGISANDSPKSLGDDALLYLGFRAFPIDNWTVEMRTEDHILDMVEFLWDRVSKPGEWGELCTSAGVYNDYYSYDEQTGKDEFRRAANVILAQWGDGFELNTTGQVQALGTPGLREILIADVVPFDEANVDSKVRLALHKWRGRHAANTDKIEAVRLLADVFEYLRKSDRLDRALRTKDASDLFQIANKFGIRHHDPDQKTDYDKAIWYAWMFHFYLASYHAAIRLIQKQEEEQRKTAGSGANTRTTPH